MRIAIDASSAGTPRRSGIGASLVHLLRALARIDSENEYLVCYRFSRLKHLRHLYCPHAPNFHRRILLEPILFPRSDVFHGGDARLPRRDGFPATVTVYDLFSLLRTDLATDAFRDKKIQRYHHLARRADRIIAVSESTRNDIIRLLDVHPEKVIVSHLGVSKEFRPRPTEEVDLVRAKYGLPTPYILSVASFSNRKNIQRILAAYASLRKTGKLESKLVLAGSLEHWPDYRETTEHLVAAGEAVLPGFVDDEDLPALYSGARMFVFPSLYEGFGLPPLEAMACGVPVIASKTSSMPEVVGDAGILVDPENQAEIAEHMAKLDSGATLRHTLAVKGMARSRLFTWERAAWRLLTVWKDLLQATGHRSCGLTCL